MRVESEHTDDRHMAIEIAMDHLTEDKDYYDKLEKMEAGEKKAAPRSVMNEVIEALRIRALRGAKAQETGTSSFLAGRAKPPPIPRRGNALAPVAGEITKKSDIIKTSFLRERIREGGSSNPDVIAAQTRGHERTSHGHGQRPPKPIGKQAMADVGAIAGATRGMPMGTRKGRRPPKPIGKQASSIVETFYRRRRSMEKSAGVAKRQTSFDGLPIKIEQDPGDIRKGNAKDGTTWERKMYASYGYVPGTKGDGADGDAIDVYLSASPVPGSQVYEISQNKKEGGFDEHKYMVGYPSAAAAKAEYLRHMPEWAFGSMKPMSMDTFKGMYGSKAA